MRQTPHSGRKGLGSSTSRIDSLRLTVGGLCIAIGAMMLVVPGQFASPVFAALQPHLELWGNAFLLTGAGLILLLVLRVPAWVELLVHLFGGAGFLMLACGFASVGGWTGTSNMAVVGLVTATAPLLARRVGASGREMVGSLFSLMIGLAAAVTGLTILLLPGQYSSPIYDVIRPYLPWFGAAFLTGGLALLSTQLWPVPRWARKAAHLLAGASLLAFCAMSSLPLRAWIGIAYYGGFGLIILLLPWLGCRLRGIDLTSLQARLALAVGLVLVLAATLITVISERVVLGSLGLWYEPAISAAGEPIFLVLMVCAAAAVAISVVASRVLTADLTALTRASQRLAMEDPTAPLPRSSVKEVDSLSVAFGLMREKLSARTVERERLLAELDAHNQRLQAQQEEISAQNEELANHYRELRALNEALTESEERLGVIFQQAAAGIALVGPDGRFLEFNDRMCRIVGYDREELANLTFQDITHPEDLDANLAHSERLRRGEVTSFTMDKRYLRGDGVAVWVNVSVGALRRPSGEPRFYVTVVEDISRRRALEVERGQLLSEVQRRVVELGEVNDQLEAATQAKSDFLASMSHELRTPLNAIIGFSEILADQTFGPLNDRQAGFVNNVLNSGRHLLDLINDILDLAKVEAGRMELDISQFDLSVALNDIQTIFKTLAARKGVRLSVEVEQGVPSITADDAKFKQIMYNLLSNAIKFTPEGGRVRVAATLDPEAGGDRIRIAVADTGIGIRAEDQERIFGVFEQVDSSYGRQQQGTGLGLPLTRRLVELHGGRIWVESEGEGKGSIFTFVIPTDACARRAPPPEAPPPDEPTRAAEAASLGEGSGPLVLVVEDDPGATELIAHHLSQAGYSVAVATTGPQALEMARSLRPCAITLDILLPGMDGWEVLAELKTRPETWSIPVVIVSIVDRRQLGLGLGAAEYMVKPVDRKRLLDAMERVRARVGRRNLTVLVIDDEPDTVDLMALSLRSMDFRVLQAYGGQHGIDLAIGLHPDAVILDLIMPEVDGFEVVRRLREHPDTRGIPILVHTAREMTEEDRRRLSNRVQAVASKLNGDALLRELQRLRTERLRADTR